MSSIHLPGSYDRLVEAHQLLLAAGTAADVGHVVYYLDSAVDYARSGYSTNPVAELDARADAVHAAIVAGMLPSGHSLALEACALLGVEPDMFEEHVWPWTSTYDAATLVSDRHLRAAERLVDDAGMLAAYTRQLCAEQLTVSHDPTEFLARVDGFAGVTTAGKLAYIHRLHDSCRRVAYEHRPDRDDLYRADLAEIPECLDAAAKMASWSAAALTMSGYAGWLDTVGRDLPLQAWRPTTESSTSRAAAQAAREWLASPSSDPGTAARLAEELWVSHAGTLGELADAVRHLCP